jgi:3-oxoacyl-[acyl-carrier protein] reductase
MVLRLDVVDPVSWESALESAESRLGAMTHLVNNAGVLSPDWVVNLGDVDIHRQIDVNVKGVILGTRAAARRMKARGSGHIVNIGSLASLSPVPGLSVYAASKFAVRGFSLSAALELADAGVAVTVIMPDAVQTPMLDLQKVRTEAALTFSAGRALGGEDIEGALLMAFAKRPLEVTIPESRGLLARMANVAPGIGRVLAPVMRKIGERNQRRLRG